MSGPRIMRHVSTFIAEAFKGLLGWTGANLFGP